MTEGVEKIACNPAVTFGSSLRGPQTAIFGPIRAVSLFIVGREQASKAFFNCEDWGGMFAHSA
jgi:hypothetical protein